MTIQYHASVRINDGEQNIYKSLYYLLTEQNNFHSRETKAQPPS